MLLPILLNSKSISSKLYHNYILLYTMQDWRRSCMSTHYQHYCTIMYTHVFIRFTYTGCSLQSFTVPTSGWTSHSCKHHIGSWQYLAHIHSQEDKRICQWRTSHHLHCIWSSVSPGLQLLSGNWQPLHPDQLSQSCHARPYEDIFLGLSWLNGVDVGIFGNGCNKKLLC